MSALSGQCLCSAVRFTCTVSDAHAHACHCTMCQRWSGGPVVAVQIEEPTIQTGGDNIAIYKSSDWGERQFCKVCGSHLFWRAPDFGYFGVSVGALDDASGIDLATEFYIDQKPELYGLAGDARKMTTAEVEAMFADAQAASDQEGKA